MILLSSLILLTNVSCFAALKRPKLNQDGLNRVLWVLHHREHHYTNFIQPKVLAFYLFGLEPNKTGLLLQETYQKSRYSRQIVHAYFISNDAYLKFPSFAGMVTAKLNKEKLKRMMEQKEAVSVNLSKKRRGDSASKPGSIEVIVRPPPIPESALVVQVPATSVEVIEPTGTPSSSRVVEKAPTLALDASLALRRVKSMVTKEDMDDYGKLNTDVVKRALAHSLMKVYYRHFTFLYSFLYVYTFYMYPRCRV